MISAWAENGISRDAKYYHTSSDTREIDYEVPTQPEVVTVSVIGTVFFKKNSELVKQKLFKHVT